MKQTPLRVIFPLFIGLSIVLGPAAPPLFAEKPKVYQKNTIKKMQPAKAAAPASGTEAPTTKVSSEEATSTVQKPRMYETENWIVREEVQEKDVLDDALKAFQSRKTPVYDRRVWIYNKIIDENDVFVDFITNDFNKDIVFSPKENFVYYLAYNTEGQSSVYGLNLATEKKFFINAADQFFVQKCSGQSDVVVVTEKVGGNTYTSYHIFDLEGKKVKFIDQIGQNEDLKNVVCY